VSKSRISISIKLEQVRVSKVNLVQEDHHARHTNLTGEQDVLARLRHRTVRRATTRIAPSIWAAPVIMFFT
jgi:hypothetical protein